MPPPECDPDQREQDDADRAADPGVVGEREEERAQDEPGGLLVQREGEWIDVPPMPGTLVVNDPAWVRNSPEKIFVTEFPDLIWARTRAKVPQWMIDRYGESKARKIGVVAMMGGKDKTKKRNATPPAFRDQLLTIAETSLV